jgi:peptidoglycan hydrolase-like protein with peptidoglycan-binding domain
VRALQIILITQNAGPKAQALAEITATGEFRNYTEEALIEYQQRFGISPATGYFGPRTRAQMKAANVPGLWW